MLTGESEAIDGLIACTDEHYTESKNVAFMTTMITNGTGRAIVTMTGKQTMIGSIASLTSGAKEMKTTLEIEINRFVFLIAVLSITTVVICFIVWGAWLHQGYPNYMKLSPMLVNAIAILVAFIPTGLPVSLTLSLLLMARKMAHNRVLVKNLKVIETLSCVNVIASDKTGTLTQNKMFVTNACAGTKLLNTVLLRRASVAVDAQAVINSALQLVNTCILCNEARFDDKDRNKPVNERNASGGATDVAILRYGANTLEIEDVEANYSVLSGIPFNSRNKWMAKVFTANKKRPDGEESVDCFGMTPSECIISIKGAPDILIKKCKWVLREDGSQSALNEDEHARLRDIQTDWCKQGQRVLIICKKKVEIREATFENSVQLENYLNATNDYCIVGMVGIIDKPRENIDKVIKTCRTAGIRVFMVTGDFSITAAAIATQIGIFSSDQYDTAQDMQERFKNNTGIDPRSLTIELVLIHFHLILFISNNF